MSGYTTAEYDTALQSEKAVSACLWSKQIRPSDFARTARLRSLGLWSVKQKHLVGPTKSRCMHAKQRVYLNKYLFMVKIFQRLASPPVHFVLFWQSDRNANCTKT